MSDRQLTGTYLDDLPEDVLNGPRQIDVEGEDWPSFLGRRSLPFASAAYNWSEAGQESAAQQRVRSDQATPDDQVLLGQLQGRRRAEGNAGIEGQIGGGLAALPAIAGEAWATGGIVPGAQAAPSIFSRAGVAAAGRSIASPSAWGRNAVQTALMPSLWTEPVIENNRAAGRDLQDPRGLPVGLAEGFLTNAVLGSTRAFGRPTEAGITGAARSVLTRTAAGMLEQQGIDLISSAVGQVVPEAWKVPTGYGLVGDVIRGARTGNFDKAFSHAVTQAVTFAAFSVMHGFQEPHEAVADLRDRIQEAEAPDPNFPLGRPSQARVAQHITDGIDRMMDEYARRLGQERPGTQEAPTAAQAPPEAVAGRLGVPESVPTPPPEQPQAAPRTPFTPEQAERPTPEVVPARPETPQNVIKAATQVLVSLGFPAKEAKGMIERATAQRPFDQAAPLIIAATSRPELVRQPTATPPPEALTPEQTPTTPEPPRTPFKPGEHVKGQWSEAELQKVKEMTEQGFGPQEIADTIGGGVKRGSIKSLVDNRGWSVPKEELGSPRRASGDQAVEASLHGERDVRTPREKVTESLHEYIMQSGPDGPDRAIINRVIDKASGLDHQERGELRTIFGKNLDQIRKELMTNVAAKAAQRDAARAEAPRLGIDEASLRRDVYSDLQARTGDHALAAEAAGIERPAQRHAQDTPAAAGGRQGAGHELEAQPPPQYRERGGTMGGGPVERVARHEFKVENDEGRHRLALHKDGKEIGHATVSRDGMLSRASQELFNLPEGTVVNRLHSIKLDAAERGQGLGKRLFLHALDMAKPGEWTGSSQLEAAAVHAAESLKKQGLIEFESRPGRGADAGNWIARPIGPEAAVRKEIAHVDQTLQKAGEKPLAPAEHREIEADAHRRSDALQAQLAPEAERVARAQVAQSTQEPGRVPPQESGPAAQEPGPNAPGPVPAPSAASVTGQPRGPFRGEQSGEPRPPDDRRQLGGTAGSGPGVGVRSGKETAIAHEVRESANPDLAAIEKQASQEFAEVWQTARAESNANPQAVFDLAQKIIDTRGKQGITTEQEAMLAHQLIATENQIAQRVSDVNAGKIRDMSDRALKNWNEEGPRLAERRILLDEAIHLAGSEAGRLLAFRRQMLRYDYSLGRLIGRAEAADPKTALTPEHAKALEEASKKIEELEGKISHMEESMDKGYVKPTPENFDRLNRMKIESNQTKRSAESIIASRSWKTKTATDKAWDWLRWWRVNSLISGPTTYAKLAASSLARTIEPTFDNIISTATRVIPGLREVAEKADIHGQAIDPMIEAAALKYAKDNVAQTVKDYMTRGRSKLDDLHAPARAGEPPHTILDSIGNSHAAVKALATLAAYQRTKLLLEKAARQRGEPMTLALETEIGERAYQEHQRAKFQADYGITKWADNFITQGKRNQDAGVRFASNVADNVFTIRKIPTNIVLETLGERLLGVPIGATRIGIAKAKGVELTRDQANSIMRQINKGLPGLAAIALGYYLGADKLGGFWSGRRRPDDLQAGEVDIGLTKIPNWATAHQPLAMMAHLGAAVRREANKIEVHQGVGSRVGETAATARAMGALLQEIPYLHEQRDIGRADHGDFGPLARSYVVPSLLNQVARQQDTRDGSPFGTPNRRQAVGVGQNIQSGIPKIPGAPWPNRQQLPLSR